MMGNRFKNEGIVVEDADALILIQFMILRQTHLIQ